MTMARQQVEARGQNKAHTVRASQPSRDRFAYEDMRLSCDSKASSLHRGVSNRGAEELMYGQINLAKDLTGRTCPFTSGLP